MTTEVKKNCLRWLYATIGTSIALAGYIPLIGWFSWAGTSILIGYVIGLLNTIYVNQKDKE
jgi:hypothetical protein